MESKQFGQTPPSSETTVRMDHITLQDAGDSANGANIKPGKGLSQRMRSAKTQAAGNLRKGTQLLFVHTVPETARNHLEDRSAMFIGLSFVVLLLSALTVQIVYYGRCKESRVLIPSSLLVDCVKGEGSANNSLNVAKIEGCTYNGKKERKNYRDCSLQLLQQDGTWVIDKHGVWNVNTTHKPAEAVWRVTFTGYTADEITFRSNMKTLVQEAHVLIDQLKGRRWVDVVHALRYRDVTVNGTTGTARITLNLDLATLVGNKLMDWGQARDLSRFMKEMLPRSIANMTIMTAGRWFGTSDCQDTIIPHGYNHLQIHQKRAVAVIFPQSDFNVDTKGNFTYTKYTPLGNGKGCRATERPFLADPTSDGTRLGVELMEEIVSHPGRQDHYTLEFDTAQAFLMDWCNNNWKKCVEDVCGLEMGDLPDEETTQCLSRRFLELGSTERFPSWYSAASGLIGFMWSTGAAQSDSKIQPREWFVVPELLPDFKCVDCNAPQDKIDCQAFLAIELHYFKWPPASPTAKPEYFTSFEWNLQLDGSFNAENTRANIHCDASSLKFVQEPADLVNSLAVPFDLTKGSAECVLLICLTWLERLSLSFSNVVLLYTVLSVGAVMGVMYFRANNVKANRQRMLVQAGTTPLMDSDVQGRGAVSDDRQGTVRFG